MPRFALLASVCLLTAGCNSAQLQFTTLRQSRTIPDLQQMQALDNLARIASDPGVLPYFNLVSVGTSSVTDRGAMHLALSSVAKEFTRGDYGADAERAIAGNWTVSPTNDPNRLAAMRAACLVALERDDEITPLDLARLDTFLSMNYPGYTKHHDPHRVIPAGWLCMGDKSSRPKHDRYVAHWNGTYIWVKEGHLQELANFSLIYLDIATLAPKNGPPRQISRGEGAATGEEKMRTFAAERLNLNNKLSVLDAQAAANDKLRMSLNELHSKTRDDKQATKIERDLQELNEKNMEIARLRQTLVTQQAEIDVQRNQNELTREQIDAQQLDQVRFNLDIPDRLNGPALNSGLFLLPRP